MPTVLEEQAAERGTFGIRVTFRDENAVAVVPNSGLTWKLTDAVGTVVNSRTAQPLTSASTVTIVLQGADLALSAAYVSMVRVLTVEGTYSGDLGTNLPIKEQVEFTIVDLVGVT
jgi:hypothetical protein